MLSWRASSHLALACLLFSCSALLPLDLTCLLACLRSPIPSSCDYAPPPSQLHRIHLTWPGAAVTDRPTELLCHSSRPISTPRWTLRLRPALPARPQPKRTTVAIAQSYVAEVPRAGTYPAEVLRTALRAPLSEYLAALAQAVPGTVTFAHSHLQRQACGWQKKTGSQGTSSTTSSPVAANSQVLPHPWALLASPTVKSRQSRFINWFPAVSSCSRTPGSDRLFALEAVPVPSPSTSAGAPVLRLRSLSTQRRHHTTTNQTAS